LFPAQMASICIRHVGALYRMNKGVRRNFLSDAAMPYDNRVLSIKGVDRVSILTLEGRLLVPFVMIKYQSEQYSHAKGQSDLVRQGEKWFMLVTVDLPEGNPIPTGDFISLDFAAAYPDSDGKRDIPPKSQNGDSDKKKKRK